MVSVKQWADRHLAEAWSRQLLFGFESGCKCEDMLMCVQTAVQTADEWPKDGPLVLCNTDVLQAFDFVKLATVAECLRCWGFPPKLVRGLACESLLVSAEALSVGMPATSEFRMARSIRQGESEAHGVGT